jgi:PPOX class probable F420-dependent enzyme
MDLDEARAYLREHHRGVLATFRSDGRPQMSPIACGVDDEGRALISTRETAFKTKNLRGDPRASVLAFDDNWYGEWVQVDGRAEIVSLPEAMDMLVAYYRQLAGEHPDWDDYRAAMEREQRVMIRIEIERAGPDRQG